MLHMHSSDAPLCASIDSVSSAEQYGVDCVKILKLKPPATCHQPRATLRLIALVAS